MKYCPKCKVTFAGGEQFCSRCGEKLVNLSEEKSSQSKHPQKGVTFNPKTVHIEKQSVVKKKGRRIGIVLTIVIALIAIVIGAGIFFLKVFNHNTINLENYVVTKFQGYDGEGSFSDDTPKLNLEKLEKDIQKKQNSDQLWKGPSSISSYELSSKITIEAYKDDKLIGLKDKNVQKLNNHDQVTIKLIYDKEELEEIVPNIRFTGTSKKVEVELTPLQAVDPFENYSPKLTGISPVGHFKESTSLEGKDQAFVAKATSKYGFPFDVYRDGREVTGNDDIAVGDVLEIRLNESGKAALKDEGATVEEGKDSKKYKVSLADFDEGAYILSQSKIDKSVDEKMSKAADDAVKAEVAKSNRSSSPQFEGRAFGKIKEGADWDSYFSKEYPQYFYVYSVTEKSYGKSTTYYYIVSGISIIEQVENHGKSDVIENPGKTIQTFDKDASNYKIQQKNDVTSLKNYFTEKVDIYEFDMDDELTILLNWDE